MKTLHYLSRGSLIIRYLACFGLVLCGILPKASAQYVTWTFSGTVTSTTASGFRVGENCSWTFDLPTVMTPSVPGYYTDGEGFAFVCGNYGFSGSGGGYFWIANDQAVSGGGSMDGIMFTPFTFPADATFDGSVTGVTLANYSSGPTATPFTSVNFPSTINLNQFSQRDIEISFEGGSDIIGSVNDFYINGALVSQVPEPGVCSLSATGLILAALGRFLCRR
jgi:hypothetical protein